MGAGIQFHVGKALILAGVICFVLGLLLMAGSKTSFFGLGRLPGDIAYKGKKFQFHFPIVTSLLLSAVLTLIFWFVSLFTRR